MIDKLTIVFQGLQGKAGGQSMAASRKLLQDPLPPDQVPAWVKPNWKNLLSGDAAKAKANAVVAADGSGKFKTICEAVKTIPADNPDMFIIYIKAGVYAENVVIGPNQPNVMVIGDGPTATKITGSKSEKSGANTLESSTFGKWHLYFLSHKLQLLSPSSFTCTPSNTAAPTEGPAVALRIAADKAVVINCKMDGYQDTLFAQVYRQYYRDCQISGTIDFVFGGSVSIFQNCHIMARKPALGQADLVLAQNREFANDISGIVLDGCTIKAEPALTSDKGVLSYLGRPWKEYSRMIVMNSDIDGFINPSGWDIWLPNKPNTQHSYIGEYNNKGPGADVSQRVKWPSYKKLSPTEAATYCPSTFLKADSWLPPTGVSVK
ncbi:hypothetical protein DCAR_0935431 [Daucus carota subsp. sativus]|uniref:Pectinesterase n=1 Tax=Daucus carota subsp. sativus TaxID=79200 RepID=A0AAF0XZW6_DAUCS|nr:hypothetical protein DCAR_0935431 [Daucus carota subsp. sativus]